MKKEIVTTYEGKVEHDVFGSWEDCSPGLYLDTDKVVQMLESVLNVQKNY